MSSLPCDKQDIALNMEEGISLEIVKNAAECTLLSRVLKQLRKVDLVMFQACL